MPVEISFHFSDLESLESQVQPGDELVELEVDKNGNRDSAPGHFCSELMGKKTPQKWLVDHHWMAQLVWNFKDLWQ